MSSRTMSRLIRILAVFMLGKTAAFGIDKSCGDPEWTRDLLRNTRSISIIVAVDVGDIRPSLDLIEITVKLTGVTAIVSVKPFGEDESLTKTTTVDKLENALRKVCGDDWVNKNLTQVPGASAAAQAFSPLIAAATSTSGQAAQAFALEDLNGDGNVDRLSLESTGLVVVLRAADGTVLSRKSFQAGLTLADDSTMVVADFNADGKPDVAISYSGNSGSDPGAVFVMLGNGDGTFGAASRIPAGVGPLFPVAADFNGDGKLDIAVVNFNAGTVSVLPGNRNGTFGPPSAYPSGSPVILGSLVALDLNGDGSPDLAVASGNSNSISTLLNSGGRFGQPMTTSTPLDAGYLAFADFNHDGKLDLVTAANNETNAITILMGKGDGTFQAPVSYAVANKPASIAVLPLNDGYTILFTADDTTGNVLMTPVSPQGEVWAPPYNFTGGRPFSIAAGDLNGDGQPDVVVTGSSSDVSVMLAQSGSHFQAPVGYSIGQNPSRPLAVAIGDLNGDKKPDVIVANAPSNSSGSIVVLLGNGDGTLKVPTSTSVNQNAQSIALGDFNRDGNLDVAVAAYGTGPFDGAGVDPGGVTILLGKGDGTFQPPSVLTVSGLHPLAVAADDLNGDGKLDLAVVLAADQSHPVTLAIYLGQGNGTFGPAQTTLLRTTAGIDGGVAIGDLNGDGKLDLAIVSGFGRQVDILLGEGSGGFRETTAITSTDFGPGPLVMADVNHDSKLDLVIPHCCGETDATYLLGNGDGSFQKERHFVSGSSTTALAVTQFAGSRGPDLVIAHERGTWLALVNDFHGNSAPAPVSAGPSFGSGLANSFTFTFSSPSGYQNLQVVDVFINNALDGRSACYVAFVPSGAASGSVFLVDDAGNAGGPYAGMLLPGGGSVSNRQCTINSAGSSVSGSGNTLTLTLAITFSAGFAGNKVVYLSAQDKSANNSGWQALGTWAVPGAAVSGPGVGGVTPARGSSATPTYTFTFTDTNGWQDIAVANILINSAVDGRNACYVAFVPSSGSVFLVDDAGDAGGPYQGMLVPSAGNVSNSQCSIAGTGSSFSGSGNTLTLTLPITFNHSFSGNRVNYLAARNNTQTSDWQAEGTVSVP